MIKIHKASPDIPYPNTLLAPQNATDLSLRERLQQLGGHVAYGTRLISYEQDALGLSAVIENGEGRSTIRTRFLIGADGGSSTVRRGAGIPFVGTTDESDRMIVADLDLTGLSRTRWHIWPRNGGRFMALCPLPAGPFQLMLRLKPADPAHLDQAAIESLVRQYTDRVGLKVRKVLWSSVWRPNIRLAERYRRGNVLLVGDAAHVHPPTGAQGLNTGVQDAYNMGWKLAQVIAGAPDALLDSYESERRPVAARVLGLATALYANLKDRPLAAAARGDEERQLALSYRGGALAPMADSSREPGASVMPGDRAPDSSYIDAEKRQGTLFDRFRGPHFTLIAIGSTAILEAHQMAWPQTGAGLEFLLLEGQGNADFRRIYGVDDALVLVRPDGYVAAVATTANALQASPQLTTLLPQ
ncbi:hypothetical protein ASF06_18200 [Agreia sp. Leaf244]|nr:hypothetical protein ASF06_18200 [Agreia sp. Leaf244]